MLKPKAFPVKATHVLYVVKDSRIVIAFDKGRNRVLLEEGQYPFLYAPNPVNPDLRALELVGSKRGFFVSEQFLKNLEHDFWKIVELKEPN